MSQSRPLAVRLSDMLEAIGNIRADVGGMSLEEFEHDGKTRRAVLKSFSDLGEEARQNLLIHEYFRTDNEVVWNTVKTELPELESAVTWVLESLSAEGDPLDRSSGEE